MEDFKLYKAKDGEPFFGVPLGDTYHHADRDNTSVFTHSAKWNQVDHVFVRLEQQEKKKRQVTVIGAFLWRQEITNFDEFVARLTAQDFTRVHQELPNEADVEQWVQFNTRDLEDFPPQDSLF